MRICPKCGDYYADGSLAFCLADGTPLVGVDPGSQNWSEGARVIEKKANALSKQKRRLKLRRVSLGTMMILTVVVFLLAAAQNRFYLEPPPPPPPPPPATPTPTPSPSPTPTPALFKINGRVKNEDKPLSGVRIMLSGTKPGSTTTDANGNYIFNGLPAGGSYTVTPQPTAKMSFQPPSQTIDKLTKDASADFVLVQPVVYKISGRVMDADTPLRDVSVKIFDGTKAVETKTDPSGKYTFSGLPAGGRYLITPSRPQTVFNPPHGTINKLTKDESVNFNRRQTEVYRISGQVTEVIPGRPAAGIEGVPVMLKGGAKPLKETTDKLGRYTFSGVPAGGPYTVALEKKGFRPGSYSYKNLTKDERADFVLDQSRPTPTPTLRK